MNWLHKQVARIAVKALSNYQQAKSPHYQWMTSGQPIYVDTNDDNYINEGYVKNSDLYAIINYMITTASAVDFAVKMPNGELKNDHPKLELLYNPNPLQSKEEFIQSSLGYKYLTGNDYIWGNRLNMGSFAELWVLPAHRIEIIYNNASDPIGGYRIVDHPAKLFDPADVLHQKYWNPKWEFGQSMYGLSPLRAGLRTLAKSNAAFDAETAAFQNQGPPAIVSSKIDGGMSEESGVTLKARLQRDHGGIEKFNKILFTGDEVSVHHLGLSPVDLNILESSKITFRQLCRVFKFPAGIFSDDSNRTYNNLNEDKKMLYQDALIPELENWCSAFDKFTNANYGGDGSMLVVDTSSIEVLQDNKKEQTEWLKDAWWISADRKQEIMGENVDPSLKGKYFIPFGLQEYGAETEAGNNSNGAMTDEELSKLLKDVKY